MLGVRVICDIRQDLFNHLHRLSLYFYSKERSGSIASRLIGDISQGQVPTLLEKADGAGGTAGV